MNVSMDNDDGANSADSADSAAQDLRRAKESVRATIADAIGTTPPQVRSRTPIKPLPSDVAAKTVARTRAGLHPLPNDPSGTNPSGANPRGSEPYDYEPFDYKPFDSDAHGTNAQSSATIRKTVLPSAVLALLDAVLLIVALASGSTVLAVVAAALFAVFAGAALAARRSGAGNGLRLSGRDRRAIVEACRWTSSQQWTGPVASTQERALVVAAARAAQRIVRSRPWRSGELNRHGVPLAVAAELDQVDTFAFELATRHGQNSSDVLSAELADAWDKALTRVAALTAYADTLAGFAAHETAVPGRPEPDYSVLAFFLSAAIYDVH
ncbi:MAG: hypothetical protein ACR2LX_10010 [Jatrophihabitans sp.]